MAKPGYIHLHRKIQENFLWKERRVFSRAEAWIDILMEARWQEEPGEVTIGNKSYICNRGECLYSLETWAHRWKWSKSKVQRFLIMLRDRYAIRTQTDTQTTRISVCKYDEYNKPRYTNGTQTDTRSDTNLISKEVKNKKKDISRTIKDDFRTFWEAYPPRGIPPRRTGKEKALKAYQTASKDSDFPDLKFILAILGGEKSSSQWQNPQYIPMATTWLNRKPWRDGDVCGTTPTGSSLLSSFNPDEWVIPNAD